MEFEEPWWDEGTLGSESKGWLGRRTIGDETRDAARWGNAASGNNEIVRVLVEATGEPYH
jgi:hypothetical protein